jgi:hypothetical protein
MTQVRNLWVLLVLTIVFAEAPQAHATRGAYALPSGSMRERTITLARLHAAVSGSMGWSQLHRFFDASPSQKTLPKRPTTRGTTHLSKAKIKRARPKPSFIHTPTKKAKPETVPNIQWQKKPKSQRYDDLVLKYAAKHKLDPRLVKAVIAAESSFRHRVRSKAGALGLMQLMPVTAEEMGVPRTMLTNPEANIRAGAAYLAHLFKRIFKKHRYSGDNFREAPRWMIGHVLAAYNAGPRFLYKKRWFRVTRRYVKKVFSYYQSTLTAFAKVLKPKETVPVLKPGPKLKKRPNCRSLPRNGHTAARHITPPIGSTHCQRLTPPRRIPTLVARPLVGAGAVHMRHALQPAYE